MANDGARTEFEEYWRPVRGRLVAFVRAFSDDADDVVQETMLRCYEHWDSLEGDPWPWLTVVARNVAADHARKRARLASVDASALLPVALPTPEDVVGAAEERRLVRRALAALPFADRLVLGLHHVNGVPTAQIAQHTGRSDNAVRAHLCRARRRLAEQYRLMTNVSLASDRFIVGWARRTLHRVTASLTPDRAHVATCVSVMVAVTVGPAAVDMSATQAPRPAVVAQAVEGDVRAHHLGPLGGLPDPLHTYRIDVHPWEAASVLHDQDVILPDVPKRRLQHLRGLPLTIDVPPVALSPLRPPPPAGADQVPGLATIR
jgi:RNA polymerase sigma-70 factor (ECF subfamily)